ncbi:DNA alkylation repair protein [Aquimarina sp. 2201CG5-10]|uniref:DNA alkylation repair protein n=1 Tax=Aquimarina callyspongiae TaxID=3098150 RepID=UPI002AB5C0A1|nr:DNA alkylation repair protein [Aquimarina sp. 2201CG5-10]MDY8138546.1 DNA alkylation repair protein [Aquimarina sp. 2201CG5-10]
MAELLKNIYNDHFFKQFTEVIKKVIPDFNSSSFINTIHDGEWKNRELKQRMRHISITLKNHLPSNYSQNVKTILTLIEELKENKITESSLEFMFFPDFIELYGLDYFDTSIPAIEEITKFTSCEFAVRPFIIKYEEKMLAQLELWSTHKNLHVRRLASEGSRPRLPWAMAIPSFKKDPQKIIPILKNLKNDTSEYVRRSVANNLNDISKDNPEVVIDIVKKWNGSNKEINKLVKHASRTLLKEGNQEIMQLFGFGSIDRIKVHSFQILTPNIQIGEFVEFKFKISNISAVKTKIRLEYGLYYQKANGTLSKKVFKISEKDYSANSTTVIKRKQSFKIITTRKLYPGKHQVSLIINGIEGKKLDFELIKQ